MQYSVAQFKRRVTITTIALLSSLVIVGTFFTFDALADDQGATVQSHTVSVSAESSSKGNSTMWAFIAAALSFGMGALGAGFAVSNVGAAAMGAVAEKPEVAGQALIFVALAEGLVVFGFIMGLLILGKI